MEESLVKNKKSLLVLMTLLVLSFGASFGMKRKKSTISKKEEQAFKRKYKEVNSFDLKEYEKYKITSDGNFFVGIKKKKFYRITIEVRDVRKSFKLIWSTKRLNSVYNIGLYVTNNKKYPAVIIKIDDRVNNGKVLEIFDLLSGKQIYLDIIPRDFYPVCFVSGFNKQHVAMIESTYSAIRGAFNISILDLKHEKILKKYDKVDYLSSSYCKDGKDCLQLVIRKQDYGRDSASVISIFDLENGVEVETKENLENELREKVLQFVKLGVKLEKKAFKEGVQNSCEINEVVYGSCDCFRCVTLHDLKKIYDFHDGDFGVNKKAGHIAIIKRGSAFTGGDNPRLIVLKDSQNFVDRLVKNNKYKDCQINCQ